VRRNRIEIFARAMGVRGRALRRMDRRPRYVVAPLERAQQQAFFARQGLEGRPVVGVQLRADESYRDYPHMAALVGALAREHPVLLFADGQGPGLGFPGVVMVAGRGLREAFALAAGCSVLVTPDSAFCTWRRRSTFLRGALRPTDGARARTTRAPSRSTRAARWAAWPAGATRTSPAP
jgi:hypothetical protein